MSARIDPAGVKNPTASGGVGVLPTKPVARISNALFEDAVRRGAIHDDQIRISGIAYNSAVNLNRNGFCVLKQIEANVRDLEVGQAANRFHEALEH